MPVQVEELPDNKVRLRVDVPREDMHHAVEHATADLAESVGGTMESLYFGFGESDVYVTVDLPDNESAAAVAIGVNAAGGATVRTTVLLSPEEVDGAAKRSVSYRPPGS